MRFLLNRQSGVTYSTQVNHQAIAQLVAGRLLPGDRLPSVRELAQGLAISRSTAERIHESLCEAMLAEVRPRSGTFVASPDVTEGPDWAYEAYNFLKEAVERARRLGIDHARLVQLIGDLYQGRTAAPEAKPVLFSLIATRDWYECVVACLSPEFHARLVQIPPQLERPGLPVGSRYLLAGYYMHERARRLSERTRCPLVHVRYNVRLLDEAVHVPHGEHRYFVTRDLDNADATRAFLADAYPEIDPARYSVLPLAEWRASPSAVSGEGLVYATITAMPHLAQKVSPARLRALHPLLPDDFIDEMRYLAVFA